MDEPIRQAFQKVKQDIMYLLTELNTIRAEILQTSVEIQELRLDLRELKNSQKTLILQAPTHSTQVPTTPTDIPTHTNIPTDEQGLYGLKSQNIVVSTGNEGVPTDRQTNQQTDNKPIFRKKSNNSNDSNFVFKPMNSLDKAKEILDSLDSLKKELRLKFKKLTEQEMHIFALLYQLDEEGELVDYSILAKKTSLSESSIRDYIRKISGKGIPIIKEKLNNKRVLLHISKDLKKIANLDTILRLRSI
jgi:hypothetical protein